jgi:hypothetical protein
VVLTVRQALSMFYELLMVHRVHPIDSLQDEPQELTASPPVHDACVDLFINILLNVDCDTKNS